MHIYSIFVSLCCYILIPKVVFSDRIAARISTEDYFKQRDAIVEADVSRMLGYDLELSSDEELVNELLLKFRDQELETGFHNLDFAAMKAFVEAKDQIDQSPIYKFMKRLPKGAVLHSHDIAMTSVEWVISEITYWDDLYMCSINGGIDFRFFFETPDDTCDWLLVSEQRKQHSSDEVFDAYLLSKLTMMRNDDENIDAAWVTFFQALGPINGLLMNKEAHEAYLYRAMEEHMEDNVSFLEMRSVITPFQDKNGKKYDEVETYEVIHNVIEKFKSDYSDRFFGMRYIFSPPRAVPIETVWDYVNLTCKLTKKFPVTFAGFDLPGQEDKGPPLTTFIEPLLTLAAHEPPIQFFFHSGETDWNGMPSDGNLYDAILFNSTRLGHAYALNKHPELVKVAREKDIAIEVNPISNQVFRLVTDIRNHPAIALASDSFPLVISSDSPSIWEATPLSDDFYVFFMNLGKNADLRSLKKLVQNSVRYSSLLGDEKEKYQKMVDSKWDEFMQELIEEFNL